LAALASCCTVNNLFLALASSSASLRNLASWASYVALAAVALDLGEGSDGD
jgi:hypothetical protein